MSKSQYQNPKAKSPNQVWSTDFFILRIFRLKILYIFFILDEYSRFLLHFSVSAKPSAVSCARALLETTEKYGSPEIILSDRDSRFRGKFRQTLKQKEIKHRRIPPRCPLFNSRAERFVGSMRRELLNHLLPFSRKEALFYLSEYQLYYNFLRPHQGIDQKTPAELYFGIADKKPPPSSPLLFREGLGESGNSVRGSRNLQVANSIDQIKRIKLAGGLLNSYYFKKAA
jgi:transposase InsO family protein